VSPPAELVAPQGAALGAAEALEQQGLGENGALELGRWSPSFGPCVRVSGSSTP
jgi:hypothetical protein